MVLNFLTKRIFFPLFQMRERNYLMLRQLKKVEKWYSLPKEQIEEMRLNKLGRIFQHANTHCPFYTDLFRKYTIDTDRISFDTLKALPALTKSLINENRDKIVATNLKAKLLKDSTGGSTAEPMVFYRDPHCLAMRNAYQLYLNRIVGMDIGVKSALIWGAGKDLSRENGLKEKVRDALVFRRIILNATRMSKDAVDDFIARFMRYEPEIIYGYPSAINTLCHIFSQRGLDVRFVKSAITTAEPLNPEHRENIARSFGCDVYDRYTSREVGVIAQECRHHTGMHVNNLSVFLEIRGHKILVTDLENYGMPLINYEIGDMTTGDIGSSRNCECGFPGDLIQLGASRETDFLVKRDGTLIFGAGIPIIEFTGEKGIRNIQVVQKDYERLIVRIVKSTDFSNDNLNRIRTTLKKYLGETITVEFEYPEAIERIQSSGKYKYVVSELKH